MSNRHNHTTLILILLASLFATGGFAAESGNTTKARSPETVGTAVQPKWIWHNAKPPARGEKPVEACFRRTVTIPDRVKIAYAVMAVTADASLCRLYVNGTLIGEKKSVWSSVWGPKIQKHLKPGKNVIAIIASKADGHAGLVGQLSVHFETGSPSI